MTTDKTYTLAEAANLIGCEAGILVECARREIICPSYHLPGYYRCIVVPPYGMSDTSVHPIKNKDGVELDESETLYLTPSHAKFIDKRMGDLELHMKLQMMNPFNIKIINVSWINFIITEKEFNIANDYIKSEMFERIGGRSKYEAYEKWYEVLINDFESFLKYEIESYKMHREFIREKNILDEIYVDLCKLSKGIDGYKKINHFYYATQSLKAYLATTYPKYAKFGKNHETEVNLERMIYKLAKNALEVQLNNKPQDFEAWLKDRLAQEIEAENQEQTLISDAALGRQLREKNKSFGRKAAEENRNARQPEWDRWVKEAKRYEELMLRHNIKPKGYGRRGNPKLPSYDELAEHVKNTLNIPDKIGTIKRELLKTKNKSGKLKG